MKIEQISIIEAAKMFLDDEVNDNIKVYDIENDEPVNLDEATLGDIRDYSENMVAFKIIKNSKKKDDNYNDEF